ncbi:MAG TPA: hypothetical protein VNG93_08905 [Candidatus Dormibacteraeota bacterium]|nr:hypothetical protein [Candidatus Dormibacteraeota bacterium]
MELEIAKPWSGAHNNPEQRRRQSAALRQLEWAVTYLHAVESIELEDPEVRLLTSRARQSLVALELRIRRLSAS